MYVFVPCMYLQRLEGGFGCPGTTIVDVGEMEGILGTKLWSSARPASALVTLNQLFSTRDIF